MKPAHRDKMLEVLTDTDWAADTETRNSVSCSIERLGRHLLDFSVAKQTAVALSSGESEFHGTVRAAAPETPTALPVWCNLASRHLVRQLGGKGDSARIQVL